jgi:hypothetical protein
MPTLPIDGRGGGVTATQRVAEAKQKDERDKSATNQAATRCYKSSGTGRGVEPLKDDGLLQACTRIADEGGEGVGADCSLWRLGGRERRMLLWEAHAKSWDGTAPSWI